ncbi:accessory Sec system glycosylation chaperone GtfB [Staphylococcus pasteuri]|uniref:accessory Sec system glycosylation chaperone GtfB n=1 Tax=Staphylococcus pasteuri TaxID=45972 RepID=UPI000F817277|nr:accessory Sec system glycosylation chaperone GtfB [Staphylococcus pasteuri]MEB6612672.1 accessory Sec system glycosylation chaperone GtfB [Staphylococcus pasteuri]QQN54186.1 accessory Sec system glycosylation chaperone GtfB [Staphylococcus pasteuri]RTX76503.1 accessory Sec system glycosylation chaperone GtfB [Staphylococcus pasteuri]
MINLFEYYNQPTQLLHQTLELSGNQHFTICIEDDGFLPDEVTSPYQFFAANQLHDNDRPKFFNEVSVPPFWEINGDGQSAQIKDMGHIRGEIVYRPHFKTRIVSRVRWLDDKGRLRSEDHYTKNGFKFAETIYDLAGKAILKKYLTREGKEVIYENFVTGDYVLDWQGQSHFFASKVEFITYYLQQIQVDLSDIIINSLSTPFLVLHHMNTAGRGILFWQENSQGHVPGNMLSLLDNTLQRAFSVMIPDYKEYDTIVSQLNQEQALSVFQSGYLYDFNKTNQYSNHALILTNSDDIPQLETLIITHPNIQFHIAAVTEMSSKLMGFDRYHHVHLYPAATKDIFEALYQRCDIYLDINQGNEIENAVTRAFHHQHVIFAWDEVIHQRTFIAPENIFTLSDVETLNQVLTDITSNKQHFDQHLAYQARHANQSTVEDFTNTMHLALHE